MTTVECAVCHRMIPKKDGPCPHCGHRPAPDPAAAAGQAADMEEKAEVASPEKEEKRIQQHPSVIMAVVGILFFTHVFTLALALLVKDPGIVDAKAFIWDLFFAYNLYKMKAWARTWTIARTLIGLVAYSAIAVSGNDYISLLFTALFCASVLILLFGKGNKTKAVVVSVIYYIFLAGFFALTVLGVKATDQIKKSISEMPVLIEKTSPAGYKVSLPGNNWRFISSEDAYNILGLEKDTFEMCLTDLDNSIGIGFNAEDVAGYDVDLNVLADNIKKGYFASYKIIGEAVDRQSVLIEASYVSSGIEYVNVYGYRLFDGLGVIYIVFGEKERYEEMTDDIKAITLGVQQVPGEGAQ